MKKNKFGEIILDENDLCSALMRGQDITSVKNITVDANIDIEKCVGFLQDPGSLLTWSFPTDELKPMPEFDLEKQSQWFMPQQYQQMDIAEYVLSLCNTQEELQRVGEELLLFQERNLFDLLRYLKYLVDVMQENRVIWGVGRGSSVASYVLYLLGVHRVNSMFYDLDAREFLR